MSWTLPVLLTIGVAVLIFSIALPQEASAQVLASQTAQLLPPGQNTCPAVPVSGFTPYVYNNALHSFEFTIADGSYVAIAGSVGSANVPFYQTSRHASATGGVRIHVDVATTPVGAAGLPLRVTLLSARGSGQPVCITIVSATVTAEGRIAPPGPISPAPSPAPSPRPMPSPVPTPTSPLPTPSPIPTPTPAPSATTATDTVPMATSFQNTLVELCKAGGAARLWFILLAIYAVIVAAAVFGQPQLPAAIRSQEWVAAIIVVPFLLLFAIWYFAESCRVSAWVPIIATLIALAGLAAAFWDRSKSGGDTTVINLPASGEKK